MASTVAAARKSSVPELNGVVAKLEKTSAGVPTVATRKAVVPPSMARPDFAKAKPNSAMMKTGRMAGRITDMAQACPHRFHGHKFASISVIDTYGRTSSSFGMEMKPHPEPGKLGMRMNRSVTRVTALGLA